MGHKQNTGRVLHRLCVTALGIILGGAGLFTSYAFAKEPQQVIRVGRFPYKEQLQLDESGEYSGYGYDYLKEIARYTGWRYEFVDAPWDDCLEMLERGELDLLGAVMRSPERENLFDFSEAPMLSGYGVLATPLKNQALHYEDFESFDGLRVGALKGNQHTENFLAYSREHDFTPVLNLYDSQTKMDEALTSGKLDAVVLTDILHSETLRVVATFGENDAYFATSKGNHGILDPLNDAMRKIRLNDPYFNSKLNQKYYDLQAHTAISFTRDELTFIENSPPIPCVYLPEAAPISYYDSATGTVRGIAVDICRLLEERTGLKFQWQNPQTTVEAVARLSQGEALLLPAKYYDYTWAEQNGVRLTDPYLQGQMVMITGKSSSDTNIVAVYDLNSQSRLVSAVISGEVQIKQYDTITDCLDAVLRGQATAAFVNSTIASYLINDPRYSDLQTANLYSYTADVAMAVSNHADPLLLSVLNKGLHSISTTELNQSLLLHMKQDKVNPMIAHLYHYPVETVLLIACGFAILITALLLLLYKMYKTLYTDPLTKRANYRALTRDAKKLIGSHPERYALVYMDIRHFKVINDTFGYAVGDSVLRTTFEALLKFVEPAERMTRIHSDVFAMLLRYEGREALKTRLDFLSKQLSELSFSSLDKISPLYKGGVYPMTCDYENLDAAFDRAHYAKDSITHLSSNTFVFYDDVIHIRILQEKELEDSMYPALKKGEFVPYYQPKVNAITKRVVGAEALVRWMHPEKGVLAPGEFVPFYEKNGFIVNIDISVFEQVCRNISEWSREGRQIVPVSVNFSRRNIQNKELPHQLKSMADRYQVSTSLLEIEVTETEELEDLDDAITFVEQLKSYGFKISVDDYGTGYSSISFLQQLPMDIIKLDRKFILNAMTSNKAEDIMRYLVYTMRKNGVSILCEGVETKQQRDFVIGLDCLFIQGFLYATPLPKEEFESYLLLHGVEIPLL